MDSDLRRIVIVGTGNVGRFLLEQVADLVALPPSGHPALQVVGLANEHGIAVEPFGFGPRTLAGLSDHGDIRGLERFGEYGPFDMVTTVSARTGSHPLTFVDVTAADLTDLHLEALRRGHAVVTANKKPVTVSMEVWRELMSFGPRRYRFECTCGAALPVISTLQQLKSSGDRLLDVSAMPSGSLGFIMGSLDGSVSVPLVAETVLEAMRLGYTEPDPRDDLFCMDVARKALVLARIFGHDLELPDIPVEPLISEDAADSSLDDFLEMLRQGRGLEPMVEMIDSIHRDGDLARCLVEVNADGVSVGLRNVDSTSRLACMASPENAFFIRSERYRNFPISIFGPGAGPEVTAAGVLADILDIVH